MQITEHIDKLFEKTKHNFYSHVSAEPSGFSYHIFLPKLIHAFYQPYKWLIFVPFFGISTLLIFPFALLTAILFGPRACSAIFPPIWARINSKMTPMRVKTSGMELIDLGRSYVVVSNHQSLYDIFVLYGWLGIDLKWVMKIELRRLPVIGYICEKMDHIYIDRSDQAAAIASINRARKKITNGTSVIFFPEGTRSATGKPGEFKKGAFRLAVDMGLPILPITISGTRDILPKSSLDLFPGTVEMIVHPPIAVSEYDRDHLEPLIQKTRNTITAALPDHLV